MTKSELIDMIARRNPHLYRQDVERIVDAFLEDIAGTLNYEDRDELRGFGAFFVRQRSPRSGRNPMNGNAVFVEEKWVPFFHVGKEIKERLNAVKKKERRDAE